jgi:hypothetical protein
MGTSQQQLWSGLELFIVATDAEADLHDLSMHVRDILDSPFKYCSNASAVVKSDSATNILVRKQEQLCRHI